MMSPKPTVQQEYEVWKELNELKCEDSEVTELTPTLANYLELLYRQGAYHPLGSGQDRPALKEGEKSQRLQNQRGCLRGLTKPW